MKPPTNWREFSTPIVDVVLEGKGFSKISLQYSDEVKWLLPKLGIALFTVSF